jgi:monoamine oxidase
LSQYSGHWQEGAVLSGRRAADIISPTLASIKRSPA